MSDEQKQIVKLIKSREQDIEIMQLLLKHQLTKKRAEYKLQILYYKVCNVVSKAKLELTKFGIDSYNIEGLTIPQSLREIDHLCQPHERERPT